MADLRLIFCLLCLVPLSINAVSQHLVSKCSVEETKAMEKIHEKCIEDAEARYSGIFVAGSERICHFLDEAVIGCSNFYTKCYEEAEMRKFRDIQLEIFIQLMRKVYKLGSQIDNCEIIQEYERSGRKGLIEASSKCTASEVKDMSTRYNQCNIDANIEMRQSVSPGYRNPKVLKLIICKAISKVVHVCGELLNECYTEQEVADTKEGQLQLMKTVFDKLLESKQFDVNECEAYGGLFGSNEVVNSRLSSSAASNHVKGTTFIVLLLGFLFAQIIIS